MERYHIYKLGFAILFYAIYYRRPTIVGALLTDQSADTDEYVYYQGVQGKPGTDFPVYARIPRTTFSCKKVESGYYADLETSCQVFHICNDGAKISFLCPNGTIFQQADLICEWWFKVNCTSSPEFYSNSAELLRGETWRRKNLRKIANNRSNARKRTQHNNITPSQQIQNGDTIESTQSVKTKNVNNKVRSKPEYANSKPNNRGERGRQKFKENDSNLTPKDDVNGLNSDETQIPEETASFYKNNQNIIQSSDKPAGFTTNRYPNHKETYSEVQEPKFFSTRVNTGYSQTMSPQTFATNRIPLNEGKPFIVSTPKSIYDINFNARSSKGNALKQATTESFKYSPTIPPFTTKKTNPTTVVPKIIVDTDSGSDSNERSDEIVISSRPNSQKSYVSTPNYVDTQGGRSISFTERINAFSEIDGILHTPIKTQKDTDLNNQSYNLGNTETDSSPRDANYGRSTNVFPTNSNNTPRNTGTQSNNYDKYTTQYLNNAPDATRNRNAGSNNYDKLSKIDPQNPDNFAGNPGITASPREISISTNSYHHNKINTAKPVLEVVSHKSQVSQNNNRVSEAKKDSSYGDACGDDIVYPELTTDQIVTGKKEIIIDDTSVPSSEINGQQPIGNEPKRDSKITPFTDSTIFRISLNDKFGDDGRTSDRANGFYVTKQYSDGDKRVTIQESTSFSSANTYLPKATSTETYLKQSDSKSNTYLPKVFSTTLRNSGFLPVSGTVGNTAILKETSNVQQSLNTRDNHLSTSAGVPQVSEKVRKEFALRPKPFELPPPVEITDSRKFAKYIPTELPDYKVSSARPFSRSYENVTPNPTLPTLSSNEIDVSEHVSNMLNMLKEIIAENNTDSVRPGLIIPPSVGPQTLHTLAVYFANALDGVSDQNVQIKLGDDAETINQLLTHSTLNRYRELFKNGNGGETTISPEEDTETTNDLEGQYTKSAVTPRVRQLAQVFTKALSSYLENPNVFKKVLQEARPTEPSTIIDSIPKTESNEDDELLNYSDADINPNLPRLSTTTPSPSPTWGYIFAPHNSTSFEYNSLGPDENLQSADSQSFVSQFNTYVKEKHFGKTTPLNILTTKLPSDHWTSSENATKLWKDKLYTNPLAINENLNGASSVNSQEVTEIINTTPLSNDLNSTQVHRILIDIINSTNDEGNKLKRILNKLNTTEKEFLVKMREVEQNPLTRRLILLLISECGSNITKNENKRSNVSPAIQFRDLFVKSREAEEDKFTKGNSQIPVYVDHNLKDDDEDTRALELLNSLYTIASKYGK